MSGFEWMRAHWEELSVVLYVLANLAKRWQRPDPNATPIRFALWVLLEAIMVTAHDQWGGPLKLPGTVPSEPEKEAKP